MTAPKKVTEYKTREYWDCRFQKEESYEWLWVLFSQGKKTLTTWF